MISSYYSRHVHALQHPRCPQISRGPPQVPRGLCGVHPGCLHRAPIAKGRRPSLQLNHDFHGFRLPNNPDTAGLFTFEAQRLSEVLSFIQRGRLGETNSRILRSLLERGAREIDPAVSIPRSTEPPELIAGLGENSRSSIDLSEFPSVLQSSRNPIARPILI